MALSRSIGNHDAACEASAAIVCVGLDLEAKIALQRFAAVDLRLLTLGTETMPDLPAGCRGLVSFGVAGALTPELRSGDIILASQVIGKTEVIPTDDVWSSWLLLAIPNAIYAPIADVGEIIADRRARNELALKSGAVAVDTESYGLAQAALGHTLRFISLRVVIDAVHRNVPAAAINCVSDRREVKLSRLGRGLLARPADVLDLLRLGRDWPSARKALLACSEALRASVAGIGL